MSRTAVVKALSCLFVLSIMLCTYARLWEVLYWEATGEDMRAKMTACPMPISKGGARALRRSDGGAATMSLGSGGGPPAPTTTTAAALYEGASVIFSTAVPVYKRGGAVAYYPGYKMCNAVVAHVRGRRHIVAFAEARTVQMGGYPTDASLPRPPVPGGCDDRAHHAIVYRVSADDGRSWSKAKLVVPDDTGDSYSDVTAGVHQARGALVVLMVKNHREYMTTHLLLDEQLRSSGEFGPPVNITNRVHPASVRRAGKLLATETYCNTGHTTTVYDKEARDLIFPASLGGERKGAFLIVLGAGGGWSLRGEALLEPVEGHTPMEPAIAVEPATGLLVANCRDFGPLTTATFFAGNRRVEFYSKDMGRTWQRDERGRVLAHRTNLTEPWLTSGSTAGVASADGSLYYVGVTSAWVRLGLALFRKAVSGAPVYHMVRTLAVRPTMTQNLLVDNGRLLGVVYEHGEEGRPLFGVVFQARRIVYRPLEKIV